MNDVSTKILADNRLAVPELANVRWLAQEVLPRSVSLSQDLPVPSLVSTHLRFSTRTVRDYVLWWVTHPDPRSRFAARTRWLHWLPRGLIMRAIMGLGYDGLVYPQRDAVLGHAFYQRRGNALYGFSTAVDESLDGHGYSVVMMLDYLAFASQTPNITKARVGRGQNNVTRRLLARIKKHEGQLGWHVSEDGWVTFPSAVKPSRAEAA